jgi:DHA2 family methylenomycin A resistance protein-like MFS transporter
MVPLELFRSRRFSASAAVGVLLNLGFNGLLFVVPLYFQREHHLSALPTGLALLPMAAMPMFASPLGGRVAARTGPHVPMTTGLIVGAIGLTGWQLASQTTHYETILAPLVLTGGPRLTATAPPGPDRRAAQTGSRGCDNQAALSASLSQRRGADDQTRCGRTNAARANRCKHD